MLVPTGPLLYSHYQEIIWEHSGDEGTTKKVFPKPFCEWYVMEIRPKHFKQVSRQIFRLKILQPKFITYLLGLMRKILKLISFFFSFEMEWWGRSILSDEGLTLETSAFESLYSGQFTLSNQIIIVNGLNPRVSVVRIV